MLVERNESRTTIQARIRGIAKPRGDSCFRNFRSSSNMERKTPTKTIWWPQRDAIELAELKCAISLRADWVLGRSVGPQTGQGVALERPEERRVGKGGRCR